MKKETHVLVTFKLSKEARERIRAVSDGINLTVVPVESAKDISAARWEEADVLYTRHIFPEAGAVPNLKWCQVNQAGVDAILPEVLDALKDVKITTMSGVIASQVAEYVLMALLALGHHLPRLRRYQQERHWPGLKEQRESLMPLLLRQSAVAILGYGRIGRQVARLLQPFGATVLAIKKDVMHPQDSGYVVEGQGDPQGAFFHRLYPMEALKSVLAESDFVVVTLPLTKETRGVLNAEALAAMKQTAYLINVGRGGVVDQEALVRALDEGRLAGAALDVFAEEPLPEASPLWEREQVIINPHVAGLSPTFPEDTLAFFVENLQRFLAGSPLYNVVDLERGY